MHAARSVARVAATAARTGSRAQSTAAAANASGASTFEKLFFDAPEQNSLDETFPGVPAISGHVDAPTKVQISKLQNGLTVVSQDSHHGAASVGVFVKGGSRTENVTGTAFAVEHLAFGATQRRTALKLFRDVDVFGGKLAANAGKEAVAYTASATRDALPELMSAVAETIEIPKLDAWELQESAYYSAAKLQALKEGPGAVVADLHAAVFGEGSELGHHTAPSAGKFAKVTTGDVKEYLSGHVHGANMVLAGVNVHHADLLEQADMLLLGLPQGQAAAFTPTAPRGGEFITRTDSDAAALGLGFGLAAPDAATAAALQVLQAALGGADGPRMFTNVRKNWLATLQGKIAAGEAGVPAGSSIASSLQLYSDAALFAFTGATAGASAGDWLATAVAALKDVAGGKLTAEEIARAKNVAILEAVGPLDGVSSKLADMGKQVLFTGKHADAAAQAAALAKVDKAAVEKAAATLLKSGVPGVALQGDASALPRFDALAASML